MMTTRRKRAPRAGTGPPGGSRKAQKTSKKASCSRFKPKTPEVLKSKSRSTKYFEVEDEVFEIGDDVYIAVEENILQPDVVLEDDDADQCIVCNKYGSKKSPVIECTKCLHGYHLKCLKNPLTQVPQGLWICENCRDGHVDENRPLTSAREYFLQQKGLSLGRIEGITYDSEKNEYFIVCRWFCLPEETHIGRKNHHTAREVFLSSNRNRVSADAIFRRARVISLSEFSIDGDADADMFICDYEYDFHWKRFYRISEWDQHQPNESDDDDEVRDMTFDVHNEYKFRGGTLRNQNRRRRYQGGTHEGDLHLGTYDTQCENRFEKEDDVTRASRALSLATVPESMPCREEERAEIEDFMRKSLERSSPKNKSGRCLYICGIPGTGKTASVLEVARQLGAESKSGALRKFHFVEINGLQLPSPMHVYSQLYEALTGETLGPASAAIALEEIFLGRSRKGFQTEHPIIVLIDEMDSIVNKSQKALYNLFDWPSKPTSHLSIIGIANTMDLPERLHARIGSRLAGSKVVFHPYQREDLEVIIRARLDNCTIFEKNAITFASRKVANCSGDVRRCLELCRRAIEIALQKSGNRKATVIGVCLQSCTRLITIS